MAESHPELNLVQVYRETPDYILVYDRHGLFTCREFTDTKLAETYAKEIAGRLGCEWKRNYV